MGHPLERIIIEHRCKTVGPKILIEYLLPRVSIGRYCDVLPNVAISWLIIHLYVNSLRLAIHMIHALIHLLHTLVEWGAFAEELIHEVSKTGKGVPRSHSLGALWLLLGNLLLRLRHWLRRLLSFLFFVADWSTLSVSSSRSVVDVHSIKRTAKLV